jgi:hypothetical protein
MDYSSVYTDGADMDWNPLGAILLSHRIHNLPDSSPQQVYAQIQKDLDMLTTGVFRVEDIALALELYAPSRIADKDIPALTRDINECTCQGEYPVTTEALLIYIANFEAELLDPDRIIEDEV